MLKLYDYFRSSACFRVRIALNLKQVPYEIVPIHLVNNGGEQFKQEYTRVNPQSLVPSLLTEAGVISQSLAIIEWLDETYPTPTLLPDNAYDRAQARSLAFIIAADIHPLNNLRVLKYLTENLNVSEDEKSIWYQNWVSKGLLAFEKQLEQKPTSSFCFGEQPTIADICLVPQMYNARRFNCDLTAYPNLVRIDANCQRLPAFTEAWPTEKVA